MVAAGKGHGVSVSQESCGPHSPIRTGPPVVKGLPWTRVKLTAMRVIWVVLFAAVSALAQTAPNVKTLSCPNNPGGGTGDSASIKYYPYSGEACVLEIKVTNDSTDNIKLNASGIIDIPNTLSVSGTTIVHGVNEAFSSLTSAISTVTHDCSLGSIFYHTSIGGNFTVNFRGSSGTTLASLMAVGDAISVSFLNTNGSSAYYNSAVQVDGTGTGVTTKWQGGTAPTSGNASAVDVYNYVIIKTATTPTYLVLASQTKFA